MLRYAEIQRRDSLSIEITDQHDVVLPFAAYDGQESAVNRVAEIEKVVSAAVHDFLRQIAVQWLSDKNGWTGAFGNID